MEEVVIISEKLWMICQAVIRGRGSIIRVRKSQTANQPKVWKPAPALALRVFVWKGGVEIMENVGLMWGNFFIEKLKRKSKSRDLPNTSTR